MGFEVGIVGAGIHGASAAYHLAARGIEVVIFDKGAPASGPTGLSSGVCRAYYTNDFLASAAHDSIKMMARFPEYTGGRESGFHRTGFVFLHPEQDRPQLLNTIPKLNDLGVTVELLEHEQLARDFACFDLSGISVGVWEPDAGYADPASTTGGMFARAVELGVEPRLNTAVAELRPLPQGGAKVVTADGARTSCERVLIAAGPWTRPLARRVGAELPLTVERHVVATGRWARSTPLGFGHADLVSGYYFKPEGEELFCIGSLHSAPQVDPDDYSGRIHDEEVFGLAQAVLGRVPGLADAEIQGGWASLYDVSPDWQPVIGEIADGIFIDAGTSGHGFKLAPALGRYVAELVVGRPDPRLEQFHPGRFSEARLLQAGYGAARILG